MKKAEKLISLMEKRDLWDERMNSEDPDEHLEDNEKEFRADLKKAGAKKKEIDDIIEIMKNIEPTFTSAKEALKDYKVWG